MMLWSLHTENIRLISRGIIFDVLRLRPIISRHLHVTDTFVNFAAFTVAVTLKGLNIAKGSFKVIHFGDNRKLVSDFM